MVYTQGTAVSEPLVYELVVPTNNNSSLVFNREFMKWEKRIDDVVKTRCSKLFNTQYTLDDDAELLTVAKQHASAYAKPTDAPVWITLTHPLYVVLSHSQYLQGNQVKADVKTYLNAFATLLHAHLPRDKVNIVLLDTLHHYAAATSRLLEQGLVDRALFTEFDGGEILDVGTLQLSQHSFYCGGGYNDRCFKASLGEILDNTLSSTRVVPIIDLVLDSPQDRSDGIRPRAIVWPRGAPLDRRTTIDLAGFYQTMGVA